jgi:hypothetical protein
MADLINSSCPLEVSGSLVSAANLFSDRVPPGNPGRASETAAAAASSDPDESARFRAEMRRRCEAPLLLPPGHDGLNE